MLRKLGIAVVLLFVVLPGTWLAVEHLRGRAQLAEVLDQLKATGATLDIDQLKAPYPSPISNGMPAMLAAASRLNSAGPILPPAIQWIAPGRAVPPNLYENWPGTNSRNGNESSNSWATIEAWIATHAGDYEALRQALDLPVRRQPLDFSVGFTRLLLPHLAPTKSAATALSLSAAAAARRGDFETAVADLEGLRIVSADLATEPILISQLVRIAVASIANARTWAVAYAQPWTEPQLAMLQASFSETDFAGDMARSLQGERALCYAEITRHSTDVLADLWFGDASNSGNAGDLSLPTSMNEAVDAAGTVLGRLGEGIRRRVLFPIWRFGWGDQALAFYLGCADRMIEANRAAAQATSLAKLRAFDVEVSLFPGSAYARLHTVLAANVLPALEKALAKALRTQTECSLGVADLAVRRYQLRHHRLPQRLQDLVPDFLASVPLDGMDGQPIRYRRENEKSYVVWSIGEDLVDNGGDGSWPEDKAKSSNRFWWNARDAVLPQPATPEQFAAWSASQKASRRDTQSNTNAFRMSAELMKRYGLLPKSAPTNAPVAK